MSEPILKQPLLTDMAIDEDGDRIVARGEFDQKSSSNYIVAQCALMACISCFIPCALCAPAGYPAVNRQMSERELILT